MIAFLHKNRQVILYSLSLVALLLLLRVLEYRYLLIGYAFEVYVSLVALLFTGIGIWLAQQLPKTNSQTSVETVVIEKPVYCPAQNPFVVNEAQKRKHGISGRELEVLALMAAGYSNQEIADQLFVSLTTIKTHSSNLFMKLDVRRRTQAVDKGRRLQLIA